MYVSIINFFLYRRVIGAHLFFVWQIIKRNWLLYCLLLFMQIRKKEDDCNVHRRMLIIFVNSSRGVALIHSSKWNRNQPMNNLIERHTSRWRKKRCNMTFWQKFTHHHQRHTDIETNCLLMAIVVIIVVCV